MSTLRRMTPLLLDVGVPLAVYYLLRQTALDQSWCYAAGAVTGGVIVGRTAIKQRKLDWLAGFVLLGFVMTFLVSLATGNVKLATLTDSLISGAIGIALVVSALAGRPAFRAVALRVAGTTPDVRRMLDERWETQPAWREVIGRMTWICGAVLIVEALVRVGLVVALGPDAVVVVSRMLQVMTGVGLTFWAISYAKRSAHRWSAPVPAAA
ncbi:hypothetical protein OG474_16780 [Kribbella sp. NBC_01505]|uniref:VC0807 family protein n=1 Tax=Kribbella sp. NBC_01505 TaxID=2903580 RepID=UPI0038709FC5